MQYIIMTLISAAIAGFAVGRGEKMAWLSVPAVIGIGFGILGWVIDLAWTMSSLFC